MGHIISKKKRKNEHNSVVTKSTNSTSASVDQPIVNSDSKPKVEGNSYPVAETSTINTYASIDQPLTKSDSNPVAETSTINTSASVDQPLTKSNSNPVAETSTISTSASVDQPPTKSDSNPEVETSLPPVNSLNQENSEALTTDSVTLSLEEAAKSKPETPEEMWKIVKQTSLQENIDVQPMKNRKGWKTIRLFVSSTFKDFHQEREVLVKEVFPDLRLWCEARKLRLVECDLRWGVPKDSTTEDTIKICLSELDRCYEDNTAPFFLNLAGDRAGWIPSFDDLSFNVAAQYGWVYGMSVTEMEVVHGAFRKLNPNALFLLRQVEGQDEIPEEARKDYFNEDPFLKEKLKALKDNIITTFPDGNVKHYSVKCDVQGTGKIQFKGLNGEDSDFSNQVFSFFQQRIEKLYPLDPSPMDPLQIQRDAHEMFLDSRSSCVLGRDKILQQIENYVIDGNKTGSPLLVVGFAGAGKSALMAKSAHRATELSKSNAIKTANTKTTCRVFFHFVGATPRSTDLAAFLQRLTKEIKPDTHEVLSDLDSLINLANNLLSNDETDPIVIFVDAINQIDEDKQQYLNRWLPEKLSANVRVVVSTIESTVSHQTIRQFKTSPMEIICGPLDKNARRAIVENILRTYNKRLDEEQITALLDKVGSSNPLWLTLACEELRVHGKFETVINKIQDLPDELISLEETVFKRFEGEAGGELMKACVCMLEVSRHGLLETELLALLGEKKNIKVPEYTGTDGTELLKKTEASKETTENIEETKQNISKLVQETYVNKEKEEEEKKEDSKDKMKSKRAKGKKVNFLPAREWAIIYRNLKPLLRPCGDLGEGRLDFYHRSLSKAVRRKYFSGEEELKQHIYNFWHGVLADYFEGVDDMDRKAEELPYHLEQLLDNNRLIQCLMDWEVFNRMYSEEFSIDLLHSWRQCGGYGIASAVYREQLTILRNSGMPLIEYVEVVEKVYGFLIQAGQYSEALELMKQRLDDEMNLGMRPDEMADVYQNMALCMSEIDKSHQYLNNDQLDDNKLIVEYGRKCLDYRKKLSGADNDYRCALANILVAHHLSNIADLTHEPKPRQEAFEAIENAIEVFTQLNDIGHLAECAMTKSIIDFGQPFEVREKLLKEAAQLCLKGYGEKHLLTTRIYLNTGIAYEMQGQTDVAFDYFLKLKDICMAVFGPGHPKTARAINTLDEPRYKRMLQQQQRTVPETA